MSAREGILLIGGHGFLGLALARTLADTGHRVHVLSRNTSTERSGGISFHRGSQEDANVILPLLKECNTVVHLAATTTPGSSARKPMLEAEENLLPAIGLIEHMSAYPPNRLIFVSSGGALYGDPEKLPVREKRIARPLSYYAAGKVGLESFFHAFAHGNNVSLAILRPANLYGPGQTLRGGFGVVRTLLEKALHNEPFEVWGNGDIVRDYLYIDDAVQACHQLIDTPSTSGQFNAGSGIGTSLKQLIALAEDITGKKIQILYRRARRTDVRAIVLDSARLREATGWAAGTTPEKGLQRTWEWLRKSAQ